MVIHTCQIFPTGVSSNFDQTLLFNKQQFIEIILIIENKK